MMITCKVAGFSVFGGTPIYIPEGGKVVAKKP